ncbi:sensor histidine kinase [Nocardia alni]|uniref:sensor histidine kinase n=1 Tax=Nocardia alni TaxID=2815723 RepID=UPI001C21F6ED|nr:ATP-binding protein [Nocardia alni]
MTVRTRLTVFYGTLFLVTGFLLISVIVIAVFSSPPGGVSDPGHLFTRTDLTPDQINQIAWHVKQQARHEMQMRLLQYSAIAIAVMTLIAIGSGAFMARSVLRPVRTVSATARRLSEHDLHERVPVPTQHDELSELAETFNTMLTRLERAFAAQRRFIANASHELRGPITTQRTLADVALAEPGIDAGTRELATAVREVALRQQRLVEGLFELALSQHGPQADTAVDLAALTREVLERWAHSLTDRGLTLATDLSPTLINGDPTLLDILLDNLIRNAITHNRPGGWLRVHVADHTLAVENPGPQLRGERLAELSEPFRRGETDRMIDANGGAGLGLAVVHTITDAHHATVSLRPRDNGGLLVRVRFPAEC